MPIQRYVRVNINVNLDANLIARSKTNANDNANANVNALYRKQFIIGQELYTYQDCL